MSTSPKKTVIEFFKGILAANWRAFDDTVNSLTPVGRFIFCMFMVYAMSAVIIGTIYMSISR